MLIWRNLLNFQLLCVIYQFLTVWDKDLVLFLLPIPTTPVYLFHELIFPHNYIAILFGLVFSVHITMRNIQRFAM